MDSTHTVDLIEKAGGKKWTMGGKDRYYFNRLHELYGLECDHYGTGNISSATLDGDKISNSKAREILSKLNIGKVWWQEGKFYSKDLSDDYLNVVVDAINEKIKSL